MINTNVAKLKRASTALVFSAACLAGTALNASPASALGQPNRNTFTEANPPAYVTLNSITDNSDIGDERNFVGVKDITGKTDLAAEAKGKFDQTAAFVDGHTYMVRIYVRNDATDAANLAAKNVRVRSYFNSDASDKGIITGAVVASNILMSDNSNKIGTRGNRGFFWDTVDIRSGDGTKFSLTMKDKPRYYNVAHADGVDISSDGKTLGFMPDNAGSYAGANVSDTGAAVGYDKMDGNLPSGKQYAGYAVYTLTAKKADQHIGMTLSAKTADQSKYATDSITVKPGDKVNFKIDYKKQRQQRYGRYNVQGNRR